ncbi:hypothetical protein ACH5RR_033834 [Cinchona calisaya]|uniref:Uncharacterized protein n=1 Tax=Cinchona calisaya TaxID=153742 RepID=A0ABD2YAG2_9GENT
MNAEKTHSQSCRILGTEEPRMQEQYPPTSPPLIQSSKVRQLPVCMGTEGQASEPKQACSLTEIVYHFPDSSIQDNHLSQKHVSNPKIYNLGKRSDA